MSPAQDILKSLIGELKDLTKTETIVGAPITVGEYTLIPISRVSLGVGAGGGTGEAPSKKGTGEGGGGGGGVRMAPVALVAIHGGELTVHRLGPSGSVARTVERMPDLLESTLSKAFDIWQSKKSKEEKQGS